jgi:hypothetical protein
MKLMKSIVLTQLSPLEKWFNILNPQPICCHGTVAFIKRLLEFGKWGSCSSLDIISFCQNNACIWTLK